MEIARDQKKMHFQIICEKFHVMELDWTTYFLEKLRGYNLKWEGKYWKLESQEKK
jgi:hypothetical protein